MLDKKNESKLSGHIGVYLCKESNKWQAAIYIDGHKKYLGLFEDVNDAIVARKEAEIKYGVSDFCYKSNNTSGHIGVNWHKESNKWLARIRIGEQWIPITEKDHLYMEIT